MPSDCGEAVGRMRLDYLSYIPDSPQMSLILLSCPSERWVIYQVARVFARVWQRDHLELGQSWMLDMM